MKKIASFLFVLIFAFTASANNLTQSDNNQAKNDDPQKVDKIEIYYFHGTRRCETCKAVGNVSQTLLETKYKENPKVTFVEINYDEPGNEEIVEKFQVTGSGLYVYNGKDTDNITAFAFQYALTNPDKLKNKLIQLINRDL
jgi:hypothetical protein